MSNHTQVSKILHRACELLTLLFTSLFALSSCPWLHAETSLIRPGATWVDDRGQAIDAHGGSVIQWHGLYFWFGEARALDQGSDKRHINCYASPDLIHWSFRRTVVELADPESLGKRWVLERPKVFVSAQTVKFVLYAHLDDARYRAARVAQFASDNIDGEYKYIRSFRPLGKESRDIGQFVDDDGSAYLIFESRPSHGFYIAALSADAMNIEREVSFLPTPLEGGALVHYHGRYYVVGSQLTGWHPNRNLYAVADSLAGPWSSFRDIAAPEANTYGGQSSLLLKIKGSKASSIIFMGDIWKPETLSQSSYLWMPLDIRGDDLYLPVPRPWTIDLKSGKTTLLPQESKIR